MPGFLAFMACIAVAWFLYHEWKAWQVSKAHFDAEIERMKLDRMIDGDQ